jgi:hypothetical protein
MCFVIGTAVDSLMQVFSEPQWEELLPAPQPGQKPMTLIVSLDDLLVSSTWDVSCSLYFARSQS